MTAKIEKKIVGYRVQAADTAATPIAPELQQPDRETMHENIVRPERLHGSTYKVKTPQSEHALYITINDLILNEGSEHEERRPYEVFINSKNMEHYQWVLALTRLISAVFRKGGEISFLAEELKAVFDPKGGYFKRGGVYMPSLVAEIGHVIETHLKHIGAIKVDELSEHTKQLLAEKRQEFEAANAESSSDAAFPEKATLCGKCNTKAVILMDGCQVCLACGDSKCN